MHDTNSMLADLNEAIQDLPDSATIVHAGGVRSVVAGAFSDISHAGRMIEDEGIVIQADASFTFSTATAKKAARTGDKLLRGVIAYRVIRATESRVGVSTTLELKEVR